MLLVTGEDTRAADNLSAQYLAQRTQLGSGTTDERVRPVESRLVGNPRAAGRHPGRQQQRVSRSGVGQQSAEILSSRSERSEVEYRSGEDRPAQQAEAPMALSPTTPRRSRPTPPTRRCACAASARTARSRSVPNTRESKLAPYLDAWRRKVERLGTLNFPQIARSGRPAIRSSKWPSAPTAGSARRSSSAPAVARSSTRRRCRSWARHAVRSVPEGAAQAIRRSCVSPTSGSSWAVRRRRTADSPTRRLH